MKKFRIMVAAYGYAVVEAENADAALKRVDDMTHGEFDWDKKFSSEDAEIVEELEAI